MKVLFVIPRTKSLYGDELAIDSMGGHPHVGIAYLTGVLKQADIEVEIFDEMVDGKNDQLDQVVANYQPDLIGVTTFSYCFKYAVDIIAKLKEDTTCPIVIGGPHVSATRAKVLTDTQADYAIKGEGEVTLVELIRQLEAAQPDFKTVEGLIWKTDKDIVENTDRTLIQNLDDLPLPDYSAFKLDRYSYTESRTLPIITSRGCPYKCNFCSVRLSFGQRFRARSAEAVVDEMQYWYNNGWNRFEINDDCFSFDIDRAIRICDLIIEKDIRITYQLYNGIRPDRTSAELLEKMKTSGCTFISYGCESGSPATLKAIRKGFNLDHVRNSVEMTNKVGIKNSVNFIIGHPGETYESAMQSVSFAESLPTNFVNFYNLVPYPGTELLEWIKINTRVLVPLESYLEDVSYRDITPIFETPEFTEQERKKVLKKGFALYDRTILRFRFGRVIGRVAYLFTRIGTVARLARTFALYNRFGIKLYRILSIKSRG